MTTKEVFQFNELRDEAKENAREWFREGAFDYEWWDFTYDDATQIFGLCGFTIDRIYFSGFWNQGDGACFEGSWRARDVKPSKVEEEAPRDQELHRIAFALEELASKYPDAGMSVKQKGHYNHEYSTEFSTWLGTRDVFEGDDMHEEDIVDNEAEEEIVELSRCAMRWIYRALNKEYDYQNADEQVDESILANEYEFTEDGHRYRY